MSPRCYGAGVFSFWGFVNVNVDFVVDGFNLYHSLKDLRRDRHSDCRWLDLRALCGAQLQLLGPSALVGRIYYFSALATHLQTTDPGKVSRHRTYVAALESVGVAVQLGRFKRKDAEYRSSGCYVCLRRHEEKETDVGIALKVVDLAHDPACDAVALVSGDTDVAPALRSACAIAPAKPIYVFFPYRRVNKDLKQLATRSFRLLGPSLERSQFPQAVDLPSGRRLFRPPEWA